MYNNYTPMHNNNYNYVDDYLKYKIGKKVEVHVSFSDSIEWRDSEFTGILETVGKDYIVVNSNSKKIIIWCIYIDYIVIE